MSGSILETLEFEMLRKTSIWRVSAAPWITESEIPNKLGQETQI